MTRSGPCGALRKNITPRYELVGIDCDGFDLRSDQHLLRFDFPVPQLDAAQARAELVRLSEID